MKIIGAQGEAEALKIQKAAEVEAYRMQAEAEAMEMKMKGYTYQQETSRQVGLEAMKNGLGGSNGVDGGIGDVAGLGVALGAMGGVIGMTKDAIAPIFDNTTQIGQSVGSVATPDVWNCVCGQKTICTNFCPNCGAKKPQPITGWDCSQCGQIGITSNFCPNCGAKKTTSFTWDCSCGTTGISTNFCPNCGSRKPESTTWNCSQCGNQGILGKFCPECGEPLK